MIEPYLITMLEDIGYFTARVRIIKLRAWNTIGNTKLLAGITRMNDP